MAEADVLEATFPFEQSLPPTRIRLRRGGRLGDQLLHFEEGALDHQRLLELLLDLGDAARGSAQQQADHDQVDDRHLPEADRHEESRAEANCREDFVAVPQPFRADHLAPQRFLERGGLVLQQIGEGALLRHGAQGLHVVQRVQQEGDQLPGPSGLSCARLARRAHEEMQEQGHHAADGERGERERPRDDERDHQIAGGLDHLSEEHGREIVGAAGPVGLSADRARDPAGAMLDQVVPARPKQVLDQARLQPGRELGDRVADVTHRHEREQRPDDQRAHEEHDQGADVERQPHGVGPAAGKLDHRRGLRLRGIGHDPQQRDQAGEADALDHAGHQQAAQHGPRVDPLRLEEQSNDVAQVSRRTLGSCRVAASEGPSTAWLARQAADPLGPRRGVLHPRRGARQIPPDAWRVSTSSASHAAKGQGPSAASGPRGSTRPRLPVEEGCSARLVAKCLSEQPLLELSRDPGHAGSGLCL